MILFNFSMHCLYIIILADYILEVFVREVHLNEDVQSEEYREHLMLDTWEYTLLLGLLTIYPLLYEGTQASLSGVFDYVTDLKNYGDLLNIFGGFTHILIVNSYGPHNFPSRVTLIVATLAGSFKLFLLLRVFTGFAPVVAILM